MVSTGNSWQRNRKLLSQLDDFDPHITVGSAVSAVSGDRPNVKNNDGQSDREFTYNNYDQMHRSMERH